MNNVMEIATMAFAFMFYVSLLVKQHLAYRRAEKSASAARAESGCLDCRASSPWTLGYDEPLNS